MTSPWLLYDKNDSNAHLSKQNMSGIELFYNYSDNYVKNK